MTDPIQFASATPRYRLPLLFAGQAQKEFTVNEAHALTDALLHLAVEGEAASPPPAPVEGDCWLVHATPSGDWADHAGHIACRQSGTWLFIAPRDGMRAFNRATGQDWRYAGGWLAADAITAPVGGATIDAEARAAIGALLEALATAGIIPPGAG